MEYDNDAPGDHQQPDEYGAREQPMDYQVNRVTHTHLEFQCIQPFWLSSKKMLKLFRNHCKFIDLSGIRE